MAGIQSAIAVGTALGAKADSDLEEAEAITAKGEDMTFAEQTEAQGLVTGAVFSVGQGSEIIKQAGKTADSMTNKMGAKS